MVENEKKYLELLEKAWAAAIAKPRVIGRKGGAARRKRRWTEPSRVGY